MSDFLVILKRNFLTANVIAIYLLAIILLMLNESRDGLFISSVITFNTLFAIFQEIRARHQLKKLELMNKPIARLVQKNQVKEVPFDRLKIGNKIKLLAGDEIPADGIVITSNGLEVNEALMSGESASIEKQAKSKVFGASVVTAGSAIVRVVAVGSESKVGIMSSSLKTYNPKMTPTQKSITTAIAILTYSAIVLSLVIYIVYSMSGYGVVVTLKTIASLAVATVPDGLLLASTLLFAYGSIKLAKANVLPQKTASIEAMSLIQVMCIDKTGTLTDGNIKLDSIEYINNSNSSIDQLIAIIAKETSGGNATGEALLNDIEINDAYRVIQTMSFSSSRKMSGVKIKINNAVRSVIMGAPELIAEFTEIDNVWLKKIKNFNMVGKRVLLVAEINDTDISLKDSELFKTQTQAIALVVLSNGLRLGVRDTIAFLQNQGVTIKVISGDNPDTVSFIAKQAGVIDSQKTITGLDLAEISEYELAETIKNTTIFARILPDQKEMIIKSLQSSGYFTSMIGDGVNDALALKKSDLGIAMLAGSVATRRVADMVLMDNSFNSLPIGMKLGDRIVQSIELIAILFFHKIIQWVVLLMATLSLGQVYPFLPRHITFMNIFLVTMPTIMWTAFNPLPNFKLSPKNFWRDTLLSIIPIAFLSGLTIAFSYTYLLAVSSLSSEAVSTITVVVAVFFGVYIVYLAPLMFDIRATSVSLLAKFLYGIGVFVVFSLGFGVSFLRDFFDFTIPGSVNIWPLMILLVCVAILQWKIACRNGEKMRSSNRLS